MIKSIMSTDFRKHLSRGSAVKADYGFPYIHTYNAPLPTKGGNILQAIIFLYYKALRSFINEHGNDTK